LVAVFCAAVGVGQLGGLPSFSFWGDDHSGPGLRRSLPTKVSIPALGVRAKVVEVGRAEDGSIAVPESNPSEATGWYGQGPTPGEPGTAVIVGHVDTETKPAVFHKLAELAPGKTIEVNRQDRKVATFTVDSVETFPKTAFPADRIFAAADKPRLVLVTCGGQWQGGAVGYADNILVFATLT
jgi:sortase (surface protein transpeptidase)